CFHLKPNSNFSWFYCANYPLPGNFNKLAVTVEFIHFALTPGKNAHHGFSAPAQCGYSVIRSSTL
ncbi:hypothetical protein ABTM75_19335, partial [Acinetobacter baumannii]